MAILSEQMFKWHQLRGEGERTVDWATNKERPASRTRTNNGETTHLSGDERSGKEGARNASTISARGAFICLLAAGKYVHFPVECLRRRCGLMLGVRWSGGCCVPVHLARISTEAIEPRNIQASTLLQIHIRGLESHCQTTVVNTPQIPDKALHKRAHLRGRGCVCLYP